MKNPNPVPKIKTSFCRNPVYMPCTFVLYSTHLIMACRRYCLVKWWSLGPLASSLWDDGLDCPLGSCCCQERLSQRENVCVWLEGGHQQTLGLLFTIIYYYFAKIIANNSCAIYYYLLLFYYYFTIILLLFWLLFYYYFNCHYYFTIIFLLFTIIFDHFQNNSK